MTVAGDWCRRLTILLLLMPGLGLILALIGTVIVMAVAQSLGWYNLGGESHFDPEFWSRMLGRKSFLRAIGYSLKIAVLSAFLSVAAAYPLALWLRQPFAGSLTIGAVLKAPLLVHGLVAAFLFINIISYNGLLNQLMQRAGIWAEPHRMQNDPFGIGVIILQVWKQMPFALLLLTGAVQGIGDDILDAARDMGAGGWVRFRKVIAPLTASALQAALVIIFIGALSDFSFQTIAGPTSRQSLSQYMMFFKGRGDWNSAAVVGVAQMVIALAGALLLTVVVRVLTGRWKIRIRQAVTPRKVAVGRQETA